MTVVTKSNNEKSSFNIKTRFNKRNEDRLSDEEKATEVEYIKSMKIPAVAEDNKNKSVLLAATLIAILIILAVFGCVYYKIQQHRLALKRMKKAEESRSKKNAVANDLFQVQDSGHGNFDIKRRKKKISKEFIAIGVEQSYVSRDSLKRSSIDSELPPTRHQELDSGNDIIVVRDETVGYNDT